MTEQAPAYGVTRGWIETVASLPWSKEAAADVTVEASSMADARAVLDEEHYGLDRVKDRIIEYLAVRRLRPDARPPILCFQGPPGVGKTTLARSIAKVLQRPFQRISLGGVRDEADVRGHRRTYIASMPGRLIQGLKRVGVRDPVMLLDELDKMGSDSRGDPAAAMLEVLDPEQNHAFTDHYMGVPFDLSRITFLATANDPRTIPGPLRDRMEMITVPGYTDEEKLAIACRHVVPKVLEEHGLLHAGREGNNRDANTPRLRIPRDAVELVVRSYTREAGVRGLQRCLESLCRAVAVSVAHESDAAAAGSANGDCGSSPPAALQGTHVIPRGADGVPEVTTELVRAVLGPARFDSNNDDLKDHHGDIPGVVAGLSWTAVGGDLMYIEAAVMPGGGTLQLTGQLGDVIKESALIAMSWVQSHAHALRLRAPGGGNGGGGAREFFDDGAAGGKGGLGRASPGDVYAASENDADAAAAAAAAAFDASQHGAGGKAESSATIKTHLAGDGLLRGRSVHVHLPQGAIPKDGPSAGVTMCTALVSLFSDRPARSDTAMTGEVSLRGLVLPVGGVKEKLIAAHQNGIRRVLIPARNVVDVEHEVPAATREALEIVPCVTMADVLENAFEGGYRIDLPRHRARM
jgi:ATP-dependent Lon protease